MTDRDGRPARAERSGASDGQAPAARARRASDGQAPAPRAQRASDRQAPAARAQRASDRHLRALELPVVEAARALVGCTIAHGDCSGVIVETEAYHDSEPACHAFTGLTPRTRPLFAAPGIAYVYRSYGVHALLNVVVEPAGVGAAVLIRALEPLTGLPAMRARRGLERTTDLCSGPGKLTQALGIGLELDATPLIGGPIRLGPPPPDRLDVDVVIGTRIGITRAVELPWRFCVAGNRNVSRPWPPGLLAVRGVDVPGRSA